MEAAWATYCRKELASQGSPGSCSPLHTEGWRGQAACRLQEMGFQKGKARGIEERPEGASHLGKEQEHGNGPRNRKMKLTGGVVPTPSQGTYQQTGGQTRGSGAPEHHSTPLLQRTGGLSQPEVSIENHACICPCVDVCGMPDSPAKKVEEVEVGSQGCSWGPGQRAALKREGPWEVALRVGR